MIESQFTQNIHKKLSNDVYHWKIADQFATGVPDAFYRVIDAPTAKHLWVEYKFLKSLPKRPYTMVIPNLSAMQLQWLNMANASNELTRVIVGVEDERVDRQTCGFILTPDEFETGISAEQAKARLLPYKELAALLRVIMLESSVVPKSDITSANIVHYTCS